MTAKPPILDHAATLSDATRCRVLVVLERHQLRVSELCQILQLPQSTASRHLKVLADDGWVRSRSEGTSNLYWLDEDALDESARELWHLVRQQIAETEISRQDGARLEQAVAARRARSQEFFATTAADWDRVRDELFGPRFDLAALASLADPRWTVGDLGCGTGRLSAALAPFVTRVIAVDGSPAMLEAAQERLAEFDNVRLRGGELEELPIRDGELDLAILVLALHHTAEPEKVLGEVRRALQAGGRLLLVDMLPHEREEFRQQMGHVWLGFAPELIERFLAAAGFSGIRVRTLPGDPEARGPALFVATATDS